MDANMKTLTRKRGQIKARVTRIRNFVLSFSLESHSLSSLKSRREKLEECWSDFNAVQAEIDAFPSDDSNYQDDEYSEFENDYFEIRDKIEDILSSHENSNMSINSHPPTQQLDVSDNIKLPDMPLPSFSGKYEDWTDFHDVFESMIHNSTKLPKIQKFYYLRSCLSGEALRTIKELKVTADNYDIAWTTLKRRFKNNRLSIKAHVQGILNFKRLDKPLALKLKHLYDTVTNHLTALNNLGEPTDQWGTLLVFLITEKLDSETRDRWESYHAKHVSDEYEELDVGNKISGSQIPNNNSKPYSFKMLMQFIYEQCMIQEVREESYSTDIKVRPKENKHKFQHPSPVNKPSFHTVSVSKPACAVCKEGHTTFTCKQLLSLNLSQRLDKIKKLNLCINCLRVGHKTIQCKSPHNCKHCEGRHHTVLHNDGQKEKVNPSNQNHTISACSSISGEVLLATAIILIFDNQGDAYPCRALLDSGSQSNIISQSLISSLGLKTSKTNVSVNCIGNTGVSTNSFVRTKVKSRFSNYEEEIDFLVLGKITNDLPTSSNLPTLSIPGGVNLADDHFYKSRGIDVLLGASVFYNTLRKGHIKLGDNLPVIQNTAFGWIVSGKLASDESTNKLYSTLNTVCFTSVSANLENLISSFWKIEEIPNKKKQSYEEEACENHYEANIKRQPDGRYVVKLPFSTDPTSSLGESKDQAFRRFLALERKLNRNPELKENYTLFLNEYLENEEMEKISEKSEPDKVYYLPHHPVLKESSSTTKLRVVFDASSKTSTNKSLNDVLMVGPTIQRDLISILLSFRTHMYVFTADIKQMYRKVLLDETQRDYQRILWRDNTTDPISTYRLKTVTYGIASAPFLAIRTLFQLAEDEKHIFPVASETLQHDFYVDDVLTGTDSLDQIIEVQRQLINLLERGGFELRKWCANHPMILNNIPSENIEAGFLIEESENKSTKALGILWQPSNDTFQFHVSLSEAPKLVTKRVILSDISKIFDPIGLISPVVITAKLFMQEIWSIKDFGWDEPVPANILKKWNVYRNSLQDLNQLAVERRVLSGTSNQEYEIHGFADASERAYGSCLYIRTIQENSDIRVKLLCSKSRVAPLKQLTLPRLELCAALLLSQLLNKTLSSLERIQIRSITLWTDSTIVLHWLNSSPKTWQTFVANRVSQIQELTNNCTWKHVRSQDNPADLISRSTSPQTLIKNKLWWHGPQWLTSTECNWPKTILTTPVDSEFEERKKKINIHCTNSSSFELIEKFSSWTKLLRITALCRRFIKNCKNPSNRTIGHLTPEDLHNAELVWIKSAQRTFSDDIDRLQKKKTVSNNIKSLAPYVDEIGILRVGGRLKHASISSDCKNPILLPPDHQITKLIFHETHTTTLHTGPQALLAAVRTKYWPINGKVLARSIVRKCFKCSRSMPRAAKYLMGDLPACRVQPSRPFENCGVDFCGPFYYRRVLQRKSHPVKAYVGLFVCMSTKAIHLELVPDLTTKKFLEALDRMMARRGKIKNIYSDNGTNFVGAKNELIELRQLFKTENHQYQLQSFCASASINWHFIPPHSPHFGGLWEAGVKSVKGHLKRVLGTRILSYDELETLLIKIEACVNSRPLTPLSTDPNDLYPLTPAHFLIGETLSSFPVPDLTHLKMNRLDYWQHVQQMYQNFWKRWSNEYLVTLQQRNKWTKDFPPPQPGSLVVIREDFRPPLHWEIGRVVELHIGSDGKARVATIRTSRGLTKRALVKLCPLPDD